MATHKIRARLFLPKTRSWSSLPNSISLPWFGNSKTSRSGHLAKVERLRLQNNFSMRSFSQMSYSLDDNSELINYAGVQLLSPELANKVFGKTKKSATNSSVDQLSVEHLRVQGIYDKLKFEAVPSTQLEVPELQGLSIGEHFYRLGQGASEPYLTLAKRFSKVKLPTMPHIWSIKPGWTRYTMDNAGLVKEELVDYPRDKMLLLDVEVLVKLGQYPLMACAASPEAWYSWTSPALSSYISGNKSIPNWDYLIPWNSEDEIITIAHNASYDRARLQPEYNLKATNTAFIDTMSLHVAVGGLSSTQRMKWLKYRKALLDEDEVSLEKERDSTGNFYKVSSINSLLEVAKLYCDINMDKELRNVFVTGDIDDVKFQFNSLMTYCAKDISVTHQVYCSVLPLYLEKCPHPVSFAGILTMSKGFLPCNESWVNYIEAAEKTHQQMANDIEEKMEALAEQALLCESPEQDLWLRQLDWTITPLKMTKAKFKKDGTYAQGGEPRPYANQLLPGKPTWYRSCYDKDAKKVRVTIRSRIAPYLLKLKWLGFPIYHSKTYGWTYYVSGDDVKFKAGGTQLVFPNSESDPLYEKFPIESRSRFFKIPHKNGEGSNCGNPLAKGYTSALEDGTLSSEYPAAKQALTMNTQCAYWISARERVKSQFVVWQGPERDLGLPLRADIPKSREGMILPQIATMGTVTRRAVEATWLTASNAKKNRIGSELKSMIRAPPNYCIVGADVDSEELWISSLIGDAQFRHHGATAFGWMTLQGSKADGSDMHSKTASILGISRGNAKIFNYGRIYGAGERFAMQLLLQFNPALSPEDAKDRASKLYQATKGNVDRRGLFGGKSLWYGGSESFMFNRLEAIATSEDPRTPVLNCGIPNALLPKAVGDSYMTSRINWVVQSSGVDYLHLLLVAMTYLIETYSINARFMLSVHDEVRFLSSTEDQYRTAMALQVANLWTRTMFAYRLGFTQLPESVAFFSAVDIDWVLRKEVDLDCVTPSHKAPLAPGISLDLNQLLQTKDHKLILGLGGKPTLYSQRRAFEVPKSHLCQPPASLINPNAALKVELKFLKAQNAKDQQELDAICKKSKPKGQSKFSSKANHTFKSTNRSTNTKPSYPKFAPLASTQTDDNIDFGNNRNNKVCDNNNVSSLYAPVWRAMISRARASN